MAQLMTEIFPPEKGPVTMDLRTCSNYWTCGVCGKTFAPQLTRCYFQNDTLKLRSCPHHERI